MARLNQKSKKADVAGPGQTIAKPSFSEASGNKPQTRNMPAQ